MGAFEFSFIKYAAAALLALVSTLVATHSIRAVAIRYGVMLDQPGGRRLHKRPVPRCGGISVFLGVHVSALVLLSSPLMAGLPGDLTLQWWRSFLPVSTLLLVGGIIDDMWGLRWWQKLAFQFAAASGAYYVGIRFGAFQGQPIPETLEYILTVVWLLALTNAFNLIDGLDGLATGLALIAALGLAASTVILRVPGDTVILTILAVSCLAFLRYNFNPASIFLGDSGSMFLGFTIGSIALATALKNTTFITLSTVILAVGVPIFDTGLAIWRRSVRSILGSLLRQKRTGGVSQPDTDHLHHRLLRAGLTQRRVALSLYGLSAALVTVSLLSVVYATHALGIFLIAFVLGSYVVVRHLARVELWDSGALILEGLKRPTTKLAASILYPVFDFAVLCVSWAAVALLTAADGAFSKEAFLNGLWMWVPIPYCALVLSGTYTRVWSRARISEFIITGAILGASVVIVIGASLFFNTDLRFLITQGLLYLSLAGGAILGLRALPRTIADLMRRSPTNTEGTIVERTIVIGATTEAMYLLAAIDSGRAPGHPRREIIGFVDDDPNLRKRIVHGHRVLGHTSELPALVPLFRPTELLACGPLEEKRRTLYMEFSRSRGIIFTILSPQEEKLSSPSIWSRQGDHDRSASSS